jgi:hypothetical protein
MLSSVSDIQELCIIVVIVIVITTVIVRRRGRGRACGVLSP